MEPKLVEFSDGGDKVHFGRGHYSSGYGTPEKPHAAADPMPDGVIALDKRPAIRTSEGFKWVFRGPLVDVDLEDGAIDKCPEPSDVLGQGVGGSYKLLLALQKVNTEPAGPLDHVSLKEYVQGWVDRGARKGVYKDGQIVWEN